METTNTTPPDGEFNLHRLATEIIRGGTSADPAELAAELVNCIDPVHFDAAVHQMAREYVRSVIGSERRTATAAGPSTGSRKVAAARDQWLRLIEVPEFVPSLNGWVRLREATESQVREMAQHRMDQANKNVAAARRYEKIARQMRALQAKTVADLPSDALRSAFDAKRDAA